MAGLSSPLRLAPPTTPRRAPSPTMSPGGRRGRQLGSSEESRLRALSPETTHRAFTQKPMPFDTTCDEYKIFSCIDTLTAAEKDLGARVARAAQRLKSWCLEIEQWGWNGSFEPPSEEYREQRRRSLELRIRDHVGDVDLSNSLPPLEYWGSLLSVEVESHEARLDDISDEIIKLDVEELKEHVLDMHPAGRSRPSSAGFEATRQGYMPMDDFSFLITQTLLSALPHHAQLKERLGTWTARITTLREVPRYLNDLKTAQKAMQLAWDAMEQPSDNSDVALAQWKEAVGTITNVLRDKVGSLGRRLDRMLDTLEGREDCIPDTWIDIFEGVEADYGRWAHDSRSKIIDFDVRRRWEHQPRNVIDAAAIRIDSTAGVPLSPEVNASANQPVTAAAIATTVRSTSDAGSGTQAPIVNGVALSSDPANPSITALKVENQANPVITSDDSSKPQGTVEPPKSVRDSFARAAIQRPKDLTLGDPVANASPLATPLTSTFSNISSPTSSARRAKPWFILEDTTPSKAVNFDLINQEFPTSRSGLQFEQKSQESSAPQATSPHRASEIASSVYDDESEFDEGDTAIHHDLEEEDSFVEHVTPIASNGEASLKLAQPPVDRSEPNESLKLASIGLEQVTKSVTNPLIITNDGQDGTFENRPHTPKLRSNSTSSTSSDLSVGSSSPSTLEDSPSVRNAGKRALRAPRPELNAAMSKRRAGKAPKDNGNSNPPWPPTQFQNSAEDLERKISDILTTIPAHIRLTSGPGADAPEVKSRIVSARGSRQYLRAARSVSGLKSPELTLSPAKADYDSANVASGRKSAAATRIDNDIKLYHLTQPGKEQPVKLFIRRVGENGERVMVRVGGGWADLGEYLRQYAEHHGRRTASDGKFEILGLEVKNNDAMTSPNRPESKQDRRFSGACQPTSPTTTPGKITSSSFSQDDAPLNYNSPMGADDAAIPSTSSSQRSWKGNEVGLAGPNTKRLDLSGEKQQWIEGMMKQARTVSGNFVGGNTPAQREERAESRSDSRSDSRTGTRKTDFGDLGKVGGTKRIFLRGGRPSLE